MKGAGTLTMYGVEMIGGVVISIIGCGGVVSMGTETDDDDGPGELVDDISEASFCTYVASRWPIACNQSIVVNCM